MTSWPLLLSLAHLIGLALAVGSATTKLTLLLRCRTDQTFVPVYLAIARPVTRLIIIGLAVLTLSGVGWLLIGYAFTPRLIVKLVLVGAIWVLGPIIDNAVEPKFKTLAAAAGESPAPAFLRVLRQYLVLEVAATGLFYVIVVMWVLV